MTVQGSLNSTPNTTFRIEFFSSATCDALGNGEGRDFLGATDVTTSASGTVNFSATPTLGTLVTATATDPAGNTSEFSNCRFVIEGPADASIAIAESADPVVVGTPFTYTLTMQNAGPNVARAVRVVDTLPAGVVATSAQSTRGTCTIGTSQVTCNLGNVPLGQNAIITLTVIASTAGLITNSAAVDIAQVDQTATNDTDSEQTLVQATAACGAPTVSGPTLYPAGLAGFLVTAGDVNKDGAADLIASTGNSSTVNLMLSNGAGGFPTSTPVTVAADANSGAFRVAIVDVNHDTRTRPRGGEPGDPHHHGRARKRRGRVHALPLRAHLLRTRRAGSTRPISTKTGTSICWCSSRRTS